MIREKCQAIKGDGSVKVFHPTNTEPLPYHKRDPEKVVLHGTDNMCRLASDIVIGGERVLLLSLFETMRSHQIPIIPLIYEHDGIVCLLEKGTATVTLEAINLFDPELQKKAGLLPTACELKSLEP